MPRSSRIACTHFGARPMPLQVCSGFCALRYFAGRFAACAARSAGPELGEEVGHLVAVRRHAAFELGAQIRASLVRARRYLGLGLGEQLGELFDVERFEVDGCHFGLLVVDGGTGCLAFGTVWKCVSCRVSALSRAAVGVDSGHAGGYRWMPEMRNGIERGEGSTKKCGIQAAEASSGWTSGLAGARSGYADWYSRCCAQREPGTSGVVSQDGRDHTPGIPALRLWPGRARWNRMVIVSRVTWAGTWRAERVVSNGSAVAFAKSNGSG